MHIPSIIQEHSCQCIQAFTSAPPTSLADTTQQQALASILAADPCSQHKLQSYSLASSFYPNVPITAVHSLAEQRPPHLATSKTNTSFSMKYKSTRIFFLVLSWARCDPKQRTQKMVCAFVSNFLTSCSQRKDLYHKNLADPFFHLKKTSCPFCVTTLHFSSDSPLSTSRLSLGLCTLPLTKDPFGGLCHQFKTTCPIKS